MWLTGISNVCGIDCNKNLIKSCLELGNCRNLYDYELSEVFHFKLSERAWGLKEVTGHVDPAKPTLFANSTKLIYSKDLFEH